MRVFHQGLRTRSHPSHGINSSPNGRCDQEGLLVDVLWHSSVHESSHCFLNNVAG